MTGQCPITPPPELVQQWIRERDGLEHIATQAARWGADMELEACCGLLRQLGFDVVSDLRAARRPKPLTLKERALAKTTAILDDPGRVLLTEVRETLELTRRALEQLDD